MTTASFLSCTAATVMISFIFVRRLAYMEFVVHFSNLTSFRHMSDLQYNMEYTHVLVTCMYLGFQYREVSLSGRLSPNILRDKYLEQP